MKKLAPDAFPGLRFYFTEADPSSQALYGTTTETLATELKLWLLLGDHIILSAGHTVRSHLTYEWLRQDATTVRTLGADSALVVSISDQYANVREFAADQVRNAVPDSQNRANLVDDLLPFGITWNASSESDTFRSTMVRDLQDPKSTLRRRMVAVRNDALRGLLAGIAKEPRFTRGVLEKLVQEHCPRYRNLLRRVADTTYYLSGAVHKGALPIMHEQAAELCRDRIGAIAKMDLLGHGNVSCWRSLLDDWRVSTSLLQALPLSEVAAMRDSLLGKKLRRRWQRLMALGTTAQRVPAGPLPERVAAVNATLHDIFSEELARQRRIHGRFEGFRQAIEFACDATSPLGLIPGIAMVTGAIGLAGTATKYLVALSERLFGGTEFVLLGERMTRREPLSH